MRQRDGLATAGSRQLTRCRHCFTAHLIFWRIYARYARVRAEVLRREHEAAAAEVEARRCVGGGVGGEAGGGGVSNGANDEAGDGGKRARSREGEEGRRSRKPRSAEPAEREEPPEVVGEKRKRGVLGEGGGRPTRILSGSG